MFTRNYPKMTNDPVANCLLPRTKSFLLSNYYVYISLSVVYILSCVCSPLTEECDENNVGGAGPSSGQHQTPCCQTGGQSVAEQHTQHQHRTH